MCCGLRRKQGGILAIIRETKYKKYLIFFKGGTSHDLKTINYIQTKKNENKK